MEKYDILSDLNKTKNNYERKLNRINAKVAFDEKHPLFSEIKKSTVKFLVKMGIGLEYALPFILGVTLAYLQVYSSNDHKMFVPSEVVTPAYVEYVEASSGDAFQNIVYSEDEMNPVIEYSTPWQETKEGYVRLNFVYDIDGKEFTTLTSFLDSSNDELEQELECKCVNRIVKDELDENDSLYNEDVVLLKKYDKSPAQDKVEKESVDIIIFRGVAFAVCCTAHSYNFYNLSNRLFKRWLLRTNKDKILNKQYDAIFIRTKLDVIKDNLDILTNKNPERVLKRFDGDLNG